MSFLLLSSGFFLGWSLGANDGGNIFGPAISTRMLKFKIAALIAAFFIIIGAVFQGGGATQTLSNLG
jgi:PiT family inorganic phosphate transporter